MVNVEYIGERALLEFEVCAAWCGVDVTPRGGYPYTCIYKPIHDEHTLVYTLYPMLSMIYRIGCGIEYHESAHV